MVLSSHSFCCLFDFFLPCYPLSSFFVSLLKHPHNEPGWWNYSYKAFTHTRLYARQGNGDTDEIRQIPVAVVYIDNTVMLGVGNWCPQEFCKGHAAVELAKFRERVWLVRLGLAGPSGSSMSSRCIYTIMYKVGSR